MEGSLQIVHVLPERVRLRWSPSLGTDAVDLLCAQLRGQPWLRQLQRRDASRSLVLLLEPGCSLRSWQATLAALGWRLEDAHISAPLSPPPAGPWLQVSRQLGGSMIGAAVGQVLIGGGSASIAAALAGPGAALVCGAIGTLLGAVVGSIIGGAIAEGQADSVSGTLRQLTWRKLSSRMGEEVGSRSGVVVGSALAGPVGAVAGLAVGSVLGGQLGSDLAGPASARGNIGHGRWFAGMVRDTTVESLSERLGSGLGARLTGGSEAGRQLGGALAQRFGRHVDWSASLLHHHLMPLQASQAHPSASPAG